MSVHQLKDGNWYVQYLNPNPPPRLKREYFGRGATSQARAEERNRSVGKKAAASNEGPTITDIAGEYIEAKEFNENSKKMLAIRLKANILPFFGNKPASRISHLDLERYINQRRKTVKGSTVRREIVDIKAILTWAVKRHPPLIPYNPIRDFPMPKEDDAVITPPSPQECAAILQHASHRLTRGIKLAWYTGLRPGFVEMLSLTWGHWDKELQQVVRDADLGRRYADKLVKVWLKNGQETYVLVHLEIQGQTDIGFSERMFVYNCPSGNAADAAKCDHAF